MDDDFNEAVLDEDIDYILALLDSGIDPNIQYNEENTGLILASMGGRRHLGSSGKNDIIRLLILYGADPNIRRPPTAATRNRFADTALSIAGLNRRVDIVELLLEFSIIKLL